MRRAWPAALALVPALSQLPGLLPGLDARQEAKVLQLMQGEQYAKAIDALKLLVQREPAVWQWWRYLGVAQSRRDSPLRAAASLARSRALPGAGSMNRHTLYVYAEALLAAGLHGQSKATVAEIAERFPFFHERLLDRRDILLRRLEQQVPRDEAAHRRSCRNRAALALRQNDWGLLLLVTAEWRGAGEMRDVALQRWRGRAFWELQDPTEAWLSLKRLPADDDGWRTGLLQARCLRALAKREELAELVAQVQAGCRESRIVNQALALLEP